MRHEYTLAPLSEVDGGMVGDKLNNTVTVQWIVDRDNRQIAAVREIYDGKIRRLCSVFCWITEKYSSLWLILLRRNSGGFVVDDQQKISSIMEKIWRPVIFQHRKKPQKAGSSEGKNIPYVSSNGHETRWTYYFYKPPAMIESSVSKSIDQ